MKIFIISLDSSYDRRLRIAEEFSKMSLSYEFFDATSVAKLPQSFLKNYAKKKSIDLKGYALTLGELACFHSHYQLWNKCYESNESILVLEDNVDISEHFPSLIKDLSITLEEEKLTDNLIKLSASKDSKFKKLVSIGSSEEFFLGKYTSPTTSAMGYILSPCVAESLINNIKDFINPVDDYMEKVWLHSFKVLSMNPNLVFRADIQSTIGRGRKKKENLTIMNKLKIEIFRVFEKIKFILFW
ncbi:glycosyltransferase family 25 protein [Vibrio owensii]|uniref:Glycosyl transferase family 25 domain-containing protein n=1 Tax=Vibrio owensii CAIM 1854 = LMG 25443 TaxID=1229493 RepID=A0A0C1VB10_9VIBR|nr:glycosyltransferase family 25 protein [Vibrio owensii]KIF46853.1 hypothetical protein H735_28385 [Vibrio owensii CAIM 1854 = LMG 25443]